MYSNLCSKINVPNNENYTSAPRDQTLKCRAFANLMASSYSMYMLDQSLD